MAEIHAPLQNRPVDVVGRELVKRDDDISAEALLRLDAGLGGEHHARPVPVRPEQHAVLVGADEQPVPSFLLRRPARLHLQAVLGVWSCEREHLETPAVGDDGRVASDELVQSTRRRHQVWPGLQHQVIRVGEHQVQAGGRELLVRDRLQRAVRAHRDVPRGLDDAVRGVDAPDPRGGFLRLVDELVPEEVAGLVRRELARGRRRRQGLEPPVLRRERAVFRGCRVILEGLSGGEDAARIRLDLLTRRGTAHGNFHAVNARVDPADVEAGVMSHEAV